MYDDESFLGHLKETNSLHSISKNLIKHPVLVSCLSTSCTVSNPPLFLNHCVSYDTVIMMIIIHWPCDCAALKKILLIPLHFPLHFIFVLLIAESEFLSPSCTFMSLLNFLLTHPDAPLTFIPSFFPLHLNFLSLHLPPLSPDPPSVITHNPEVIKLRTQMGIWVVNKQL